MKVSVVIPTYDRQERLRQALESVQRQTFCDYEVIVVQNGPSQSAREIVEIFQSKGMSIRYLHESMANGAHARNMGVSDSLGDYIAFLDDDDIWLPEKLERQAAVLDADAGAGMVFSHPMLRYPDGRLEPDNPRYRGVPGMRQLVEHGCVIRSFSGVMTRRSVLCEAGPIRTEYRIASDWALYIEIARRHRIAMIDEPLYHYSVHEMNTSSAVEIGFEEMIDVLRTLTPAPGFGVTRAVIRQSILKFHRHYASCAVTAMDAGRYGKAALYYARAIRHEPWIGLRILWGRFRNPVYRLFRPYAALVYCILREWTRKERAGLGHG